MDILLNKVTQQALNYAIRSGVAVTGGYAMKQCSRLLQSTPRGSGKDELRSLQNRLESKIRIISPAIDMIELIAARGNTSLESAVQLTKDIRYDIQSLGIRLAGAAEEEELIRRRSPRAKSREQVELELKLIMADMRKLLARIEDAVPLINLAITTSGVNLTTNLPATVSPSRLLQGSTLLSAADAHYAEGASKRIQVGPSYILSMYMLFAGHAWRPQDDDEVRATTWKEVIHKARVKIVRVPLPDLYNLPGTSFDQDTPHVDGGGSIPAEDATGEYSYQIVIIEDLDDDRVHTFEEDEAQPGPFDDVLTAGIRDVIPIHQISKIFYADTGKILNIGADGETNSPILLLKRDVNAEPPRRMMERRTSEQSLLSDEGANEMNRSNKAAEQDEVDAQLRRESFIPMPTTPSGEKLQSDAWKLPADLDPEWVAFEVYVEEPDSEDEDGEVPASDPPSRPSTSRHGSIDPNITNSLSRLTLGSPSAGGTPIQSLAASVSKQASQPAIKTSLSLLEMLIRLTALQQFRQASHLTIEDELLNFFLEDSSTTGAGPNAEYRQRVRRDARRRLGFDPYDESPLKRRGEEYIAQARNSPYAEDYYYEDDRGYDSVPENVRRSVESPLDIDGRPLSSPSPSMRQLRPRPSSTRSSPAPATPAHPRPVPLRSAASDHRTRQAVLRSQSEKPRSPLGMFNSRESKGDSGLGTSPGSEQ